MKLLAQRALRRALLIAIGAVLLGSGLLWLLPRPSAIDAELAAAKARWAARSFSHYRLVVREETRAGGCHQDVFVEDEQIRSVARNHCGRIPSWTVTNLFTWAQQLDVYSSRCYPSTVTCVCHAIYTSHAVYDPQLGYPQQITYQWRLQTNWAYYGHWKRLWQAHTFPNCADVARKNGDQIIVTVLSLTPLP